MDIFMPDIYQKNIYAINYKKLKKNGIRCLLFDLDNTIAPINIPVPEKSVRDLFAELEYMGFKIILLSNNTKDRVEPFKEKLNVDASYKSCKPLKRKYRKILKLYDFKDTEIACIGDQLLTDIWGANRMQFTSILVNPISSNEYFWTRCTRKIENKIFKYFSKRNLFSKGSYYE